MQIIYKENPLRTQIVLDENEKKELWYKTKIEELQDAIMSAHYLLSEESPRYLGRIVQTVKGDFNLKRVRDELDPKYLVYGEGNKRPGIDERVDELHKCYLDSLVDLHIGDCTCCPSSCVKCHAEEMFGLNTIKGLRKHAAHYIDTAFGHTDGSLKTALEWLRVYKPHADWDGWEAHADRWAAEANQAYEWLAKYRDEHFKQS